MKDSSANLLWMSPNLLTTDILDRGDTERVGNDHSSVSMSLSSPPRRSTKSSALNLLQPSSKNNSTRASVSRSCVDSAAKLSQAGVSRSRSSSLTNSLHLKTAKSTSQARLLRQHGDYDSMKDDQLLNMNPDPPKGNVLCSVSHHAKSGQGRSICTKLAPGTRQEKIGGRDMRRSASDVAAKSSRSSHLLGLDDSSSSADDDVLLNIDPIPLKLSIETS